MRRSLDVVSVFSSDDLSDYDVISDGHQSLESSIADLGHVAGGAATFREPPPLQSAQERFDTVALTADDIQAYVQKVVPATVPAFQRASDGEQRTVRVYVDGVFDPLQASEAFLPSVHLMVGVLADDLCEAHQTPIIWPHVDRCEVLRHCRWVDEVVPDAPWTLDEQYLRTKRIDYVAIDEGSSVNPACDKERLRGYDLVKGLRMFSTFVRDSKFIPIRRTNTMTPAEPRGLSVFVESTKGTVRGPANLAAALQQKLTVDDDADTNPFEEPKQDLFGIGYGI
ncbi:uncharacterized protein B0H18DRAFT_1172766 [Fomitopsis serialis]|uniref:uncharacterized protein n=1 Tax=Fomitopsis serialis TaxID=139415 RepID=UPI00200808E0|nr:uncharacterized protein B0H18DRAFT_1172766 [Neoantrodia serialis]KAH9924741.1 hypothetical protein B0H18DRAFT_1172766 [Neoantrodia serialis]